MSEQGIKTVIGGASSVFSTKDDNTATELPKWFEVFSSAGIDTIDTAVLYGDSELVLGEADAGKRFIIDTKLPGPFIPGSSTKEGALKVGEESHDRLKTQVDILYIHAPDTSVPFEDTLFSVNELYKKGYFKRFGLSNFKLSQVHEVYNICKSNGYPLPAVYQGNYNAFARSYESELIPEIRKLGLSFYAYSPQAGGFLAKTADLLDTGRLDKSKMGTLADMYSALYKKPTLVKGLTQWNDIATSAGIRPGDMALRYVKYNSILTPEHNDAIIVGGRTLDQMRQTLTALKDGPLPANVVKEIDQVWQTVKDDAPVDNYHDFVAKANKEG